MVSCRWGQVAFAAILLLASPARADELADARAAVDGSDYPAAQPHLRAALKAGTAGPAELAEIYKLTGVVEAVLGNTPEAETAFSKWLALEPKGSFPQGTSPKITRPFDVAHEQARKSGALAAKAETGDSPPSVTLVVVNDPMKMIAGAKVYVVADHKREKTLSRKGSERVTIELGAGKRIDLRLQAVDEYGNRVVELGSKDVPLVITSSEPVVIDMTSLPPVHKQPERPASPQSWYLQWWVWGIAAGVTTGVSGVFAIQTYNDIQEINHLQANSYAHPWHDEQVVEDRARRNLLVTEIGAGMAGAFAIGTVVLYMTRPHLTETEVQATIAPSSHGGSIVVGGHF